MKKYAITKIKSVNDKIKESKKLNKDDPEKKGSFKNIRERLTKFNTISNCISIKVDNLYGTNKSIVLKELKDKNKISDLFDKYD